ncbi:hypothetical protein L218DRAFT_629380 [Marasmius fiardii PR-910]|nr:hypothetical protein L218DRAFT_629380 [Marasmius fiardii PR-910]
MAEKPWEVVGLNQYWRFVKDNGIRLGEVLSGLNTIFLVVISWGPYASLYLVCTSQETMRINICARRRILECVRARRVRRVDPSGIIEKEGWGPLYGCRLKCIVVRWDRAD